jgi:hypothetical protein
VKSIAATFDSPARQASATAEHRADVDLRRPRPGGGILRFALGFLWISLPLMVILGFYTWFDPFGVLWPHQNYYATGRQHVTLNRDYVSLETFKRNSASYGYDSFIFGNSRSIFYEWKDWAQYIGSEKIFHFDASSESLLGINLKLKYLDKRSAISNCLIVLDCNTLATVTNQSDHLFAKHYALSGENRLSFHWKFLKVFLDRNFLVAYLDLKLRHRFRPYMADVLEARVWDYDPQHNELSLHSTVEKEISEGQYFTAKRNTFSPREGEARFSPEVIGPVQLRLLSEIEEILLRHRTNYRLVVSPLYNQVSLARQDLDILRSIFGANRVFDFSGVNELTSPIENYYEESHYRPIVSRAIIRSIYKDAELGVSP